MIVRFSPMNAAKLREQAEDEAAECLRSGRAPVHSVSTFGLRRPDEATTVDDLLATICREAPVGGKTVWVTTAAALQGAGLAVRRSEPPPHHYDVVLDSDALDDDVARLVTVLEP